LKAGPLLCIGCNSEGDAKEDGERRGFQSGGDACFANAPGGCVAWMLFGLAKLRFDA
jgi:hypothetical protein